MKTNPISVMNSVGVGFFTPLFFWYVCLIFFRASLLMIPRFVENIPLSTVENVREIHAADVVTLKSGQTLFVITGIKFKEGDQVEKEAFSLKLMCNGKGIMTPIEAMSLFCPLPNWLNIIFLAYLLLFQIHFYKKYKLPAFAAFSRESPAIDYTNPYIRIPMLLVVPVMCIYYVAFAGLSYVFLP